MKIRKARKFELKEISKIFKEVFNDKPYLDKWTDKTAFEHIKHEFLIGEIFVFLQERKIIGIIIIRKNIAPDGNIAEIKDFAILRKYCGRGIGSEVIKEIEIKLKKENYKGIYLETYHKSKAVDFYKKNRYKLSKYTAFMIKELRWGSRNKKWALIL